MNLHFVHKISTIKSAIILTAWELNSILNNILVLVRILFKIIILGSRVCLFIACKSENECNLFFLFVKKIDLIQQMDTELKKYLNSTLPIRQVIL